MFTPHSEAVCVISLMRSQSAAFYNNKDMHSLSFCLLFTPFSHTFYLLRDWSCCWLHYFVLDHSYTYNATRAALLLPGHRELVCRQLKVSSSSFLYSFTWKLHLTENIDVVKLESFMVEAYGVGAPYNILFISDDSLSSKALADFSRRVSKLSTSAMFHSFSPFLMSHTFLMN